MTYLVIALTFSIQIMFESCLIVITDLKRIKLDKVSKKAKISIRYNQVLHLTQDTAWASDKSTKNITYKRAFSQQGCNKQTRKHNKHETQITKMIQKRSTALERSVKYFYWRV